MKFDTLKPMLTTPLVKSVTLHVTLLLLLIFGANISFKRKTVELSISTEQAVETNPAPVEAVAIDRKQLERRVAEIQKNRDNTKKAEEERIAALERRAKQAERNRAAEEQRLKQVAAEKRQADEAARKSKAAAAEAQKQQQEEAAKARQAEEARKARELELQKAEDKRRQAAEAEAKEQAERERKAREAREQAERERQIQEQLAKEAEARRQARAQQAVTEVQRYTAMIRDAIQRNLLVDENMRGKTARINIRLASSGFVTDVRYVSGDRQVAEAAIRAVNRAGTLPVSTDPDVYNQLKDITLTVAPEF